MNSFLFFFLKNYFFFFNGIIRGTAKAAGNLTVSHGKVVRICPSSGHYRPDEEDLEWFLSLLKEKHHVDLSDTTIEEV